jgi:hypothetical protein
MNGLYETICSTGHEHRCGQMDRHDDSRLNLAEFPSHTIKHQTLHSAHEAGGLFNPRTKAEAQISIAFC